MKKRKASGIIHFDPGHVDQTPTKCFEMFLLYCGLEIEGYWMNLLLKALCCVQICMKAGASFFRVLIGCEAMQRVLCN